MGLEVGTATVTLEKRWRNVSINKTMDTPSQLVITVDVDTGFYNEENEWVTTKSETLVLEGDAPWFLFSLTESHLGLEEQPLGHIVDTAIYGVLSGQVPVKAQLTVLAEDAETGNPITATYRIEKDGHTIYYGNADVPATLPILLDVKLVVEAPGYQPHEESLPSLVGTVTLPVGLVPVTQEE